MIVEDFIRRRIINSIGIVIRWPKKEADKDEILHYIASKFNSLKKYSEIEVNNIINQWTTYNDCALTRRELYDRGLLNRTQDCRVYWKENISIKHSNIDR